jgi:alkylation response protein AidB-like acyl-CoA dehydrogenase
LSEEQDFFRAAVQKFLESEAPLAKVRQLADHPDGFEPDWWKRASELGFTSMLVPEEHGGESLGGGLRDLLLAAEEVGRWVSPGPFLSTNVVAAAIAEGGSSEQRERWLPGLISGERVAAWALLEGDGAWRGEDLEFTARRTPSGHQLHGSKVAVEAGGQADLLLVTARSDAGLSQFLVPAGTPGVSVTPMQGLDLVRRFCSLEFDAVELPEASLLGAADGAAPDLERQLQIATTLQCAESAGAAAAVFETTLEYMFDRFSFGRPLASYQALKHRFADMKMWLEACHAICEGAARAVEARDPAAAEMASAAKAYVPEHAIAIIQDCIQMHGGMGVTYEHDAHLYLRRVTQNRGLYGSPSEHREEIARMLEQQGQGGQQ